MRRLSHPLQLPTVFAPALRPRRSRPPRLSALRSWRLSSRTPALLTLGLLSHRLAAATLRNCEFARDPLACRLDAILRILYGAAFILALVLAGVVWAAVRLYRKNRTAKITPMIEEDE